MNAHQKILEDRPSQERAINSLWGLPGDDNEESDAISLRIIDQVVRALGYEAFSDEAIRVLCAAHLQEDWERGELAEADYRRSIRNA